ncbi:MAG: glycosyltransferase [Elusimicrobia bacterium]|nr:glycosyltransferase [Elusimicrobiota bacterium]
MKISIIIPAYNASKTIRQCLREVLKQSESFDCEIIVVDDGSKDETGEIIKNEFKTVNLLIQENAGPAKARNYGATVAKGDYIIFTDSDCEPADNWLEEMIRPFQLDPEIIGVKGIYKTKQKEITARFVQLEYEDKYDVMKKFKYIDFIDTYSAAFKKNIFWEVGGYDTRFRVACSEDVDLSFKLSNKGYKMIFNPNAIVYHIHPSKFFDYCKKKYKFAYWRMLAIKNNPNKIVKDTHTPQTMKIQIILIFLMFISIFLTLFSLNYAKIFFIMLFVYLVFSINFIFKAIKKDFIVGLFSPIYLFFRSLFQLFGIILGLSDIFLLNKLDKIKQ